MSGKWKRKKNGDWTRNANINFNFSVSIKMGKPDEYEKRDGNGKLISKIRGPWGVNVSVCLRIDENAGIINESGGNIGDFHQAKKWADREAQDLIKQTIEDCLGIGN